MNASARLIYLAYKFCHITPLLAKVHWLPVRSRIHYKILLITFKVLHGLSPKYLSDLISIQQLSSYNLKRNDNGRLLERPSTKTKKRMGDRAFQVAAAPFLWNKLPRSARDTTNLESFKTLIKVTPNLRGCPSEKNSYARRLQGNLHKLYIKRKVIKCTIQ